jgi:hypothetical protein
MPADLTKWPNKKEAAEIIGISTKTLERMVARGQIEQRMRPRPRASDESCYSPKDVQKAAGAKATAVVRSAVVAETAPEPGPQYAVVQATLVEGILARLLPLLPAPPAELAPEPDLLTVQQCERRGYSRHWLRQQVRLGLLRRHGRCYSIFELQRLIGKHT